MPQPLPTLAILALAVTLATASTAALADPGEHAAHNGVSAVLRGVPALRSVDPDKAHNAWASVKDVSHPKRQLRSFSRAHLPQTTCTGLVDLKQLVTDGATSFRFRDRVRGRTWARPTLARVIAEARRRFAKTYPDKQLTLGDIAQPGCGQLDHGTIIHELTGDDAVALVNRARVVYSVPTVIETRHAQDFPDSYRFDSPTHTVRVERVILGQRRAKKTNALTIRVATRRHARADTPTAEATAEMETLAAKLAKASRVSEAKVVTADAHGTLHTHWRTHWVDRKRKRQLVAFTSKRVRRRLNLTDATELRFSDWHHKKPGSFRSERRWLRDGDAWQRWVQTYEAGHISHHSGRDADISYVTKDNDHHFAVDLAAMDVRATWAWLSYVEDVAHELKFDLMILVDKSVKRHLRAHLPKKIRKTRLYRDVLRLSAGHDAHHHIRVTAPDAGPTERKARKALARLEPRK